jgi:hypothetical protein
VKRIGCLLLLLVLLPAIGLAQTAISQEEPPFYQLTHDDFFARYNAIAAERTGESEPFLQELFSVKEAAVYTAASGSISVITSVQDSEDCIDDLMLICSSPVVDLQHCAMVWEIAIRTADPSLSEEEVQAIFAETFQSGIENMDDPFGLFFAEKNGIDYSFHSVEADDGVAYFMSIDVAE